MYSITFNSCSVKHKAKWHCPKVETTLLNCQMKISHLKIKMLFCGLFFFLSRYYRAVPLGTIHLWQEEFFFLFPHCNMWNGHRTHSRSNCRLIMRAGVTAVTPTTMLRAAAGIEAAAGIISGAGRSAALSPDPDVFSSLWEGWIVFNRVW